MTVSERLLAIPSAIIFAALYSITITACILIVIPKGYMKAGYFGICIAWQVILQVNYVFTTAIGLIAQGKFSDAEKYLDENIPH